MKATVALVDDHALLRKGLAGLLTDLHYTVVFEAGNGVEFIEKITTASLPQIVLMDINMPLMNGFETTLWLKKNYPAIKVLVLSMLDDETTIIRMIKNGAKGYVLKDAEPDELHTAIQAVLAKGFYHSDLISRKMMKGLSVENEEEGTLVSLKLTEKELAFLQWACSDLTYKEIADRMKVSTRTVEGYRDILQEKLDVKGRIGLVLYAIKNGLVKI